MKKYITIIAMLFVGLTIFAQSNAVYKGGSATDPDAEYLLIRRHYTMNPDNTCDFNFHKEIKIIRNRALTAYADKGETFIVYNPSFQTLTINESYTLRPDGTKVVTPKNAFVEQLPSNCTDCARFNGLREMVVVHTGMEYGSIIVLDYTIRSKSPIMEDAFLIAQDCPVQKYEVIIDCPTRGTLFADTESEKGRYACTEVSDQYAFHCLYTDVAPIYSDSYMPDPRSLYPDVSFRYGATDALPILDTITESLPAAAAELVGELYDADPLTYVQNLRNYIVDNIRLNAIPWSQLGYAAPSGVTAWNSACGTEADKAVLFKAMLQLADNELSQHFSPQIIEKEFTSNDAPLTVSVLIDSVDYRVTLTSHATLVPDGVAQELVTHIAVDTVLGYNPIAVAGPYAKLRLPLQAGATTMNPAYLTSVRTAPLNVQPVSEQYHYTVTLPNGVTLVGGKVKIKQKRHGLGSMLITIKQEGNTLDVVRQLSIEKEVLTGKDYKAYRRMITDWTLTQDIQLRLPATATVAQ